MGQPDPMGSHNLDVENRFGSRQIVKAPPPNQLGELRFELLTSMLKGGKITAALR